MSSLWLDRHPPVPTDPFEADARYDAVVVGAGLTGLATALLLSRSGLDVAVLEARSVGAVATGNTTAKLSLLQGTVLTGLRRHVGADVARAYVDGNREGQAWLLRYLEEHRVPTQRRDAFTYATSADGRAALERELEAVRDAGLAAVLTEDVGLPFPTRGALVLRDQAQFDPAAVLAALAADLRSRGSVVVDGVRVLDVKTGAPSAVLTSHGTVHAEHVILATGAPILDRGLYFAKLEPSRSYAAAYRVPGAPESLPAGMYLSADAPGRSLRTAPDGGDELLLVGGNGHVVGRAGSTAALVADLDAWTRRHFPGAERTHRWSAQDYRSVNAVPFVGRLSRGGGRIHVATGYNKWGMTNGIAAALSLSADILGGHLPWARTLHHRARRPADVAEGLRLNAGVAGHLARGWLRAELGRKRQAAEPGATPDGGIPEGHGTVRRDGLRPVAVSRVDGATCAVSAVCTHLGGVLAWNDAERSWDCPLHGSRFAATGKLLEGPATADLKRLGPPRG
ncbi:MAG: FAD-dependent oxidoreductase [Arthrobacter sp.]|uniref:FAD-dependent oxidoreductase n=1 Tax=Arthrobacter sp. TaxID=1667 RepID=UPI0034849FE5